MAGVKFTNFASTAITTASVSTVATSFSVTAATGNLFPSPGAGEWFYLVLVDSLTAPTKREVIKVTKRTVDSMAVVVRAQEGTTAQTWVAGNFCACRATNQGLIDLVNGVISAVVGSITTTTSALISFLQTGAGAVLRSVQDKERDIVSVYDFMTAAQVTAAKALAPTDFTTAIQAAFDSLPTNGGILYFPTGGYKWTTLNVNKQCVIQGAGMSSGGTFIYTGSTTANLFNITQSSVTIRDLCIQADGVQTAGSYIYCNAGSSIVNLVNLYMLGWFRGVRIDAGSNSVSMQHLRLTNGVPVTGVGIRVEGGTLLQVDDVVTQGAVGSEPLAGIQIFQCGDASLTRCHFINNVSAMALIPGAAQQIYSVNCTNSYFDNSSGNALLVQPTSVTGYVLRSSFNQCWFSDSGSHGIHLDTTTVAGFIDSIEFTGCEVYSNNAIGVKIRGTNTTAIKFNGGRVAGNTSHGIEIGAAVSNIQVSNMIVGSCGGWPNNGGVGVVTTAGTSNYVQITDNNLSNNTGGAYFAGITAGIYIRVENNIGYNPLGGAVGITPGASPYTYTAGYSPETIYINTGTVSAVALGGVTVFSQTNCTVNLAPGQAVVVTYTAVPGMTKYVH